jgi:hypothetical protein
MRRHAAGGPSLRATKLTTTTTGRDGHDRHRRPDAHAAGARPRRRLTAASAS